MGFIDHRIKSYSLLHIFLLIYSSTFPAITTAIDTLTANQSLVYPNTLISSGAKFKLGFFTPPNSTHKYLGVMYNLPVMTVVWVANRNTPLRDFVGKLTVSSEGNLVILDRKNDALWSSNLSNPVPNSKAVLLDTGNLVILDPKNDAVWESFQHATDSVLQKMKIVTDGNEKNMLTSWRSVSDPSPGNFTFTIEPRGVPQLYIWNNGHPYWRSGPWNRQIFTGIPQMESVSKQGTDVVSNSFSSAYVTFTLLNSSLLYVVLTASGDLLENVWNDEKGEWEVAWSSRGSECDVYGKCGPFGSCDAETRPVCGCLPGFVAERDEEWGASGCVRRNRLGCGGNYSVGKEDGFVMMESVKLPDGGVWYSYMESECRVGCLDNCSCIAYSYVSGIGCMQWAERLTDVRRLSNGVTDLYIRLAYSELGNKRERKSIVIAAVILGSVTILVCAYFVRKLLFKYRVRKEKDEVILSTSELEKMLRDDEHGVKLEELPIFNFEMLSSATQNFSLNHKLGQGGFGPVYKGKLPNGVEIAVKRLARSSNQGVEEFVNEVKVISRLQHRNLVRLLGCCVESEEKMLVYEYMPNGSLDSYLFDSNKRGFLDWRTRVIIIRGICRGLLYLHRDSRLRIIHRDLKASNILLDEEMNPKISDFGMARIFGGKDDQANTARVVGTYGYMAPEYALHGIFSEKSDVFSFGVLLLEILSGTRNGHSFVEDQTLFLVGYAWKLWNEGNIVNLIDPTIYDPRMETDMQRYANVGLLCVQEIAAERPNISTLVSMLITSEIVELPHPKQPAFLGIQRFPKGKSSQKNLTKYSLNDVSMTSVEGR